MERLSRPDGYGVICNDKECDCTPMCEKVEKAMKRLAAYEDTGLTPGEIKELTKDYERSVHEYNNAYGQLQKYKDAEEQGLLIKLPCKVGDTVYRLLPGSCLKYTRSIIAGFNYDTEGWTFETIHGLIFPLDAFGKTVFLTREESESALKGGIL